MKLFIDSANVEEIKEISESGFLSGVTTNPSLIAKSGRDFKEVVQEICKLVDGPISAEPVSLDAPGIIKEAKELVKINDNIVIKVPVTPEGLKACRELTDQGIPVNVTLVFSVNQALMAARAGAAYVSPFIGRLEDNGEDGLQLVSDIAEIFDMNGIETEIIAASIRNNNHVSDSALAGADIATIPYKVFKDMFHHPLTDKGIEGFKKDWEDAYKK